MILMDVHQTDSVEIELSNPADKTSTSIRVVSHPDTSISHLHISRQIALQLGFNLQNNSEKREIVTSDGGCSMAPYVGPLK